MVRSGGKRSNTRDLFKRPFRKNGMPSISTYLTNFKIGEYVDIVANAAIQQGMPFKYYHGRTGKIFNVSRAAVGVEVTKQVGNRIIPKRFHVRIEHVKKSRCSEDFKKRVRERDAMRREAREKGEKLISDKRKPVTPPEAHVVSGSNMVYLEPLPYKFVV
uniref:60S ribosomal protein L21 n=1 Tax=Compsopogon caeruleus TaxID=31354 RepID=A0A6T6CI30_9RHOD|mmetsp:Transcript_62/g.105  ORF Transcript_62/g.105 Transcript_62/m.105 type:complete len:160 (+) Transcript_62:62-541(+)|eukprot:CAMPEP_0184680444 /NCGR_PEP_ID=MMETSP0312-20130426/3321_1 /TAXON_ID=31354 /ORGANISM="Compsopogon coeruleus, Strain SAG 36.94" /LENGTH=159 /DNA_ID=CAMNT_0027130549 /DNA_START=119 /DNA_END=598 /DNA_ORIENTATION=-